MKKNDTIAVFIVIALCLIVLLFTLNDFTNIDSSTSEEIVDLSDDQQIVPQAQEAENTVPWRTVPAQDVIRDTAKVFVDIRSKEAYDASHILGSYHVSALEDRGSRDFVIVGSSGTPPEAYTALYNQLKDANNSVMVLSGTITEYEQAGGSVITKATGTFVDQAKLSFIEPRDINVLISREEPLTIIDTRRPGNYLRGHIPGAINIPLDELEFSYDTIPDKVPVVVYGETPEQSIVAGVLLFDLRIFQAKTLTGGFQAWKEFDYHVELN